MILFFWRTLRGHAPVGRREAREAVEDVPRDGPLPLPGLFPTMRSPPPLSTKHISPMRTPGIMALMTSPVTSVTRPRTLMVAFRTCCPRFRRFVLPPFGFLSAPPEPSSDAPPVDRRPVSAKEPVC